MVEQAADQGAHKHGGLLGGTQHRPPVLLRHLQALREGLQPPGEDQRWHRIGQQPVEALPPPLPGQPAEKGVLRQADEQQPLSVEMLEKACQRQARPVYVQRPERNILVVGSRA